MATRISTVFASMRRWCARRTINTGIIFGCKLSEQEVKMSERHGSDMHSIAGLQLRLMASNSFNLPAGF
uniref:Uncharacterized protein n=1 Tax=Arundo donax TaxID=35708 RepID=A0A0A9FSM7_ARUDO